MRLQFTKSILWFHTIITILAGWCLFLLPQAFAPFWPWMLPPLAARFMGALLIGGGVCTGLTALSPEPLPVTGPALLGLGDALIISVGLLDMGEIGFTGRMLLWLVLFSSIALLLWGLLLIRDPQRRRAGDQRPLTRGHRIYFTIHLAVVIPVGLTMYLAPALAQQLWPWSLSPVNIRLLGAFFVGASILSIWSLRQQDWQAVRPLLALYAVFTTLTTLAAIIHFNLFNPGRFATWAFFALYIFVALGAWFFLMKAMRRQRQT